MILSLTAHSVAEVVLPLAIQNEADDQTEDLHLQKRLCMINDAGILHHIECISLIGPLIVKHLLGDISYHVLLQPFSWIIFIITPVDFRLLFKFIKFIKFLLIKNDFELNTLARNDSLIVDEVLFDLYVAFSFELLYLLLDLLSNFVDQISHIDLFKLAGVIHADAHKAGLDHSKEHGSNHKAINHDLDQHHFEDLATKLLKIFDGAVFLVDRGIWDFV